ncbi:MAG: hypothetical protein RR033_06770 [Clostridia bacterium]
MDDEKKVVTSLNDVKGSDDISIYQTSLDNSLKLASLAESVVSYVKVDLKKVASTAEYQEGLDNNLKLVATPADAAHETKVQAFKYFCCMCSAGVIEFITYLIFVAVLPIDPNKMIHFLDPKPLSLLIFVSEIISLALSIVWNFTFNRKFTFKSAKSVPKAMAMAFLFYVPFFPFAAWYVPRLAVYIGIFAKLSKMILNGVLEFLWQKFVIYRHDTNTAV